MSSSPFGLPLWHRLILFFAGLLVDRRERMYVLLLKVQATSYCACGTREAALLSEGERRRALCSDAFAQERERTFAPRLDSTRAA